MDRKKILKSLFVRSGVANAFILATRQRLRILMYHGISPYCLPADIFEEQLSYLQSHFDCCWASEIPGLLAGKRRSSRPQVVLTFDDGLRNNFTYAAPLLERYGIKATFYIVSDLLDGQSMLWNHELLCRLFLAEDGDLPDAVPLLGEQRLQRFLAARQFVDGVKDWENEQRLDLIGELRRRQPQVPFESWMLEKYLIMSQQELLSLPANIEIGSHTRTHPMLPSLDDQHARAEIQESGSILESISGRPVKSFCYPSGKASAREEELAAGAYSVAVSVEEGWVNLQDNRHRLRRIPVAHSMSEFIIRMIRPGSGTASPIQVPSLEPQTSTAREPCNEVPS